jgi:hypothetical protein
VYANWDNEHQNQKINILAVVESRKLNSLKFQTNAGYMSNTTTNRQAVSFSVLSRTVDAKTGTLLF